MTDKALLGISCGFHDSAAALVGIMVMLSMHHHRKDFLE